MRSDADDAVFLRCFHSGGLKQRPRSGAIGGSRPCRENDLNESIGAAGHFDRSVIDPDFHDGPRARVESKLLRRCLFDSVVVTRERQSSQQAYQSPDYVNRFASACD